MEVGYRSGKRTISGEGLVTTQASLEIQYGHFQQKTADLERGLKSTPVLRGIKQDLHDETHA